MKRITIGIVSPSWGPAKYYPERLNKCIKNASKLGFNIKFMPYSLNSNGYISDTPEKRAQDLMLAFQDPEVDIIMSMIGGNHSSQILKYLDFALIKKNFKPFVGFSDITVLHYAIISQTGRQTYYGPAFMTQFGDLRKQLVDYTFSYFKKIILEKQKNVIVKSSKYYTDDFINWDNENKERKLFINKGHRWLKKGKVTGQIIGGCIPSINRLLGTPYCIDPAEKIFFIDIPEDHCEINKGLTIADVDACFAQLDNIGLFDKIKGLIISIPYRYTKKMKKQLEELILYYTQGKNYPILMDVCLGHVDPIITIPYLFNVLIDSEKNLFVLNYNRNE